MSSGFLVILSAPSGTGKSTVCRKLLERDTTLKYSVSCSTREPRPGEIQGRHYYFLSVPEFKRRIKNGELLEWAEVHGNYYGTPRRELERLVDSGHVVLLDVDVQGAASIRRRRPDAVTVFLMPPSFHSLKERLRLRRDSEDSIERRLMDAQGELKAAKSYDYWVVNDELVRAVKDVEAIIQAERLKAKRASPKTGLKELLLVR